jgi:hypothetical protein
MSGYLGADRPLSGARVDLVDLGEHFEGMIPAFEPLFINLPELETMPDAERLRWLELLSYSMALGYHAEDPSERSRRWTRCPLGKHLVRRVVLRYPGGTVEHL